MSNTKFLQLAIEVMRKMLNDSYSNASVLSSGRILELSQALDEMIVTYQKL